MTARDIVERLQQIENYAPSVMAELDWQTNPLFVEYRSLMKQWWALPGPTVARELTELSKKDSRPSLGEAARKHSHYQLRKHSGICHVCNRLTKVDKVIGRLNGWRGDGQGK